MLLKNSRLLQVLTVIALSMTGLMGCTEENERTKIIPAEMADVWFRWLIYYESDNTILFRQGNEVFEIDEYGDWEYYSNSSLESYGISDWNSSGGIGQLDLYFTWHTNEDLIDTELNMQVEYSDFRADFSYVQDSNIIHDIYLRPDSESRIISGVVHTFERIPISSALVSIYDDQDNLVANAQSNSAGFFLVNGLETGNYSVQVIKEGFQQVDANTSTEDQTITPVDIMMLAE